VAKLVISLHSIQAFASPAKQAEESVQEIDQLLEIGQAKISARQLTFFRGRCGSFRLCVNAWPRFAGAVLPLLDTVVDGCDMFATAIPGELAAFAALHLVAHLLLFQM